MERIYLNPFKEKRTLIPLRIVEDTVRDVLRVKRFEPLTQKACVTAAAQLVP